MKKNVVLDLSIEFSLLVIEYCELLEERKKYVVANQLLKSGTSIGANIMEAQNSESDADFIHRLKIATKEASETRYWLILCEHSKKYPSAEYLVKRIIEIIKLLNSIITTMKRKRK